MVEDQISKLQDRNKSLDKSHRTFETSARGQEGYCLCPDPNAGASKLEPIAILDVDANESRLTEVSLANREPQNKANAEVFVHEYRLEVVRNRRFLHHDPNLGAPKIDPIEPRIEVNTEDFTPTEVWLQLG